MLYDLLEMIVGEPTSSVEHTMLYACACGCQVLLVFFIPYIVNMLAGFAKDME